MITETFSLTDEEQTRFAAVQNLSKAGSQNILDLIGMLTDPSWMVRRAVVEALAHSGEAAVQPLIQSLCHQRDNEARIAAVVDSLSASNAAVEEIVGQLSTHEDPAIVADVAQILGRRRSPVSIPTLVKLTQHRDDNVAVGAIEALGKIGGRATVEALIDIVAGKNFFRVFPAIDVLGRSGDPRAVEPLSKLLADPIYLPEACRALGRTGEISALIPLIDILNKPAEVVLLVVAVSLWELRERHIEKAGGDIVVFDALLQSHIKKEMVRKLMGLLKRADVLESTSLCHLLGCIGASESIPALTAALESEGPIAASAAIALKKIGRDAESALLMAIQNANSERRKILIPLITRSTSAPEIAACLNDADPEIKTLVCDTLVKLGNPSVVTELFTLLENTNLRVVHAATAAIQALGSRETLNLAVGASRSNNPVVRRSALRILSYFGDSSALQPILSGLVDADPRVQEAAIHGLPFIEGQEALEALCETALSPVSRTRALAMRSLGQLSNANEKVYTLLLDGLKDADSWTRYYSCQSLGRLKYVPASPYIAKLIDDDAGQVRVAAVEALSHFSSDIALNALRAAAEKMDLEVRRAALIGLGMVRRTEDLPILLTAAKSADSATRLVALSALINFPTARILGALSTAANDSDELISTSAISYLGARQEQEATEILVELLPNPTLSEKAKAALAVASNGRSAGLLIALESADHELAAQLVSLQSKLPRAEARAGLLAAMKLNNVAARKAAAPILAARRDSEMTLALQEASENDPDHEVRRICHVLLRQ